MIYDSWPTPFKTLVDYSLTKVLEPYQAITFESDLKNVKFDVNMNINLTDSK